MLHKHLSWVEISASALRHQMRLFQQYAPSARIFPVIKSNAYGHGMREVVGVLDREKSVAGYMVASLDEALRAASLTRKQVVILSIWQQDQPLVVRALRRGIVFPIYDLTAARWLERLGARLSRKIPVHIKIDVGTMRLGFRFDDSRAVRQVLHMPHLAVTGIFSHFADSESADEGFTQKQFTRFQEVVDGLRQEGYVIPMYHISCSAAAIRGERYHADAIRLGISLYGLWPSDDIKRLYARKRYIFRPAMAWKTRIVQIKTVRKGESIGYGLTYRARRGMRIAVLPVGYADGYDRSLSNRAHVLVGGKRCPVRGRVCMNLCMIELSRGIAARVGSPVVLLGRQNDDAITAAELADKAGTIHYEIVSRISAGIPRIIVP
ncbi:MAG: alanine racemase [Patescibacteria group bacterium]